MDRYPGGLPKSFLQPCLLLLLKEQPGYGYDLVTRLKALGIDDDSAAVYRSLRTLEEKGAVYSYWNTSSTGPARRMYRLTPAGEEQLQSSRGAPGRDASGHRALPLPSRPGPVPRGRARRATTRRRPRRPRPSGHGGPAAVRTVTSAVREFDRRVEPGLALVESAEEIARACHAMAARFHRGGKLLVFGNGGGATDAEHIAVEFVHPVIVGKRALPALSLAADPTVVTGIAEREGFDEVFAHQLRAARPTRTTSPSACRPDGRCAQRRAAAWRRPSGLGLLTVALWPAATAGAWRPARPSTTCSSSRSDDPQVVKEVHVTTYHVLWELVHVFFEHPGVLEAAAPMTTPRLPRRRLHHLLRPGRAGRGSWSSAPGDLALVDTGESLEEISVALVDAPVGGRVLVHAKEAIAVLADEEPARMTRPIGERREPLPLPLPARRDRPGGRVLAEVRRSTRREGDRDRRAAAEAGRASRARRWRPARRRWPPGSPPAAGCSTFGNGGSSTDAADVAQLFLSPAAAGRPLPAFCLGQRRRRPHRPVQRRRLRRGLRPPAGRLRPGRRHRLRDLHQRRLRRTSCRASTRPAGAACSPSAWPATTAAGWPSPGRRPPVRRTLRVGAPHPGSADDRLPRAVERWCRRRSPPRPNPVTPAGRRPGANTGPRRGDRAGRRVPAVRARRSPTAWRLAGFVGNDAQGVFIEVEGDDERVGSSSPSWKASRRRWPWSSGHRRAPWRRWGRSASPSWPARPAAKPRRSISPDTATCDDCLAEMWRPRRAPLPLPVHQLHELRAPLHHRPGRALRPAAHHHGPFDMCAAARRSTTIRPTGDSTPSPSAARRAGRSSHSPTRGAGRCPATTPWRRPSPACCETGRSWPSRDSAATTWPCGPTTKRRSPASGPASTGRRSRSQSWSPTWQRRRRCVSRRRRRRRPCWAGRAGRSSCCPEQANIGLAPSVAPGNRGVGAHAALHAAAPPAGSATWAFPSCSPAATSLTSRSPTADDDAFERLDGHRRRLPPPRPAHPHPDRRLGGPVLPRPDLPRPPFPWLRSGTGPPAVARSPGPSWRPAPN